MARVSNAIIDRQLEQLEAIVNRSPGGVSRGAIGAQYKASSGTELAGRTLQRRLEHLLIQQRIAARGDGSSTAYMPLSNPEPHITPEPGYPALSARGTRLRDDIRKPIAARKPVGYNSDWLFSYRPGKIWYLTKAQRARLSALGKTPDDDRPAGTFAKDILSRLLIDLAWASSRLEGNTYTRLDTQNLLEFGQRAEGKDAAEAQMILNHKTAIEYIVGEAEEAALYRTTVLSVHAALSENLLGDSRDEGRLRERPVSITGTSYIPSAIPHVIRECFDHIVETMNAIPDPFEQAFFAMVHIPYLQPFVDVNKRTSRLIANLPLIRANLCPLSFVDVSGDAYVEGTIAVYETRRVELLADVFMWAYERSCAQYRVVRDSVVQPDPFRMRYRDQLREAVKTIVIAGESPSTERVRAWSAANGIPDADRARFSELALELMLNLNEGSAARYGLLPSQFSAWEQRVRVH